MPRQAFPTTLPNFVARGMTLRDYVAAQVLPLFAPGDTPAQAARSAYSYADAFMLEGEEGRQK